MGRPVVRRQMKCCYLVSLDTRKEGYKYVETLQYCVVAPVSPV